MTNFYWALGAYFAVALVAFVGGLIWMKFRHDFKKRMNLKNYHDNYREEHDEETTHTHAAV